MRSRSRLRKALTRKLLLAVMVSASLLAAGTVAAQDGDGFNPQTPRADFEQQELEKFAKAYVQVHDIQEEFAYEMGNTSSEQEAKNLQAEYMEKMVDVVRDEGLTVDKYNEIADALQSDPQLREKVSTLVEDFS